MRLLWLRLPLSVKVFLICISLAMFFLLAGTAALYQCASYALRQEVRSKIEGVTRTAALQIDPELHSRLRTAADESTEAYRTLKAKLIAVRKSNPEIRYVYTMRRTDKKNVLQFVVDAEQDPELVSHIGDPFDVSQCPQMRRAWDMVASDADLTTDKWGTWLSAYAPVRGRDGRSEAIIGMDMSANQLRQEESALRRSAVKNLLVAVLLAILSSLIVTGAILKPVRTFTEAARRIRSGDLDLRVDITCSPELAEFADAFNDMVSGLKWTTKDFLTGLCNHRYFHETLGFEMARAGRFNHKLCLLILDVDRFKSVNDNLGHPIGDSILRQMADLLQENIRGIDVAARYSGDEFAVILPETDMEAGLVIADRIRETIESHQFYPVPLEQLQADGYVPSDREPIKLTTTIGLASFPEHHTTRDGIVMAADIALCRAKYIGRNCVCTYDSAIGGGEMLDPHDFYQMLRDPDAAAVQSLAAAVDARDHYTHGHSERVTDYAMLIADGLGMDDEDRDALKVAGLLHDLGKIGVPDAILNKPGVLTIEEKNTVQSHTSLGGDILRQTHQLDRIIPAVLFHHERWDGSGYPDGLSGPDIPLAARVLAIADSFDAMTSDRPYRTAMSTQAALQELQANAGKQFDPELVDIFVTRMTFLMRDNAA